MRYISPEFHNFISPNLRETQYTYFHVNNTTVHFESLKLHSKAARSTLSDNKTKLYSIQNFTSFKLNFAVLYLSIIVVEHIEMQSH